MLVRGNRVSGWSSLGAITLVPRDDAIPGSLSKGAASKIHTRLYRRSREPARLLRTMSNRGPRLAQSKWIARS